MSIQGILKRGIVTRNVPERVRPSIKRGRAYQRMSRQKSALSVLGTASKTQDEIAQYHAKSGELPDPAVSSFSFIDLFAGIGGFRVALEKLGGRCVFSSEIDSYSQKTYRAWFGDTPVGDIREVEVSEIPDHDILVAGFPCQPFSIAGVSKKKSLGKAHGFECQSQGTLFFTLATIAEIKRPPILFLENVKNILSHDGGRTWKVIRETLEDLNYWVFHKIIDASGWVPQHRERVYIACFDQNVFPDKPAFAFPAAPPIENRPVLGDILEPAPAEKYTLTDHLWTYLQNYAEYHRAKGNGFGFGLAKRDGITRTLSARYFKDGSEILIPQSGRNPRRLTPRECARLMGFPEKLPIVVSDTQAYRQFGNAVVPKVVEPIANSILTVLRTLLATQNGGCLKGNSSLIIR